MPDLTRIPQQFDKIRFDGKKVTLEYQEPLPAGASREIVFHGTEPSSAFRTALQAFNGFVVWVHSWTADAAERIEIRSVSIKRPDDAPRGIVVTALMKCPRARNGSSTINTPYMGEPPEGYAGDSAGFLQVELVQFVDELEQAADNFLNGERGEQLTLGATDNANDFDERAAAVSSASTRKPKTKKDAPKNFVPGVGDVYGAGADQPPRSDEEVRQLLMTVERDVPVDAIGRWTSSERNAAQHWAELRQRELIGDLTSHDAMPAEPVCLGRDATPPLAIVRG